MSALAKSTSLVLSLVLCGALPTFDARADDPNAAKLDEPIVIDEEPEAFFVAAPHALAAKMRRALTDACVGTTGPSLFCDGTPLRFLRGVSVYGNKKLYGFACTKDSLYARNKYFTPGDMQSRSTCVYISCPSTKEPCEVDRDQLVKAGSDS
jgi:hypothetical protein